MSELIPIRDNIVVKKIEDEAKTKTGYLSHKKGYLSDEKGYLSDEKGYLSDETGYLSKSYENGHFIYRTKRLPFG